MKNSKNTRRALVSSALAILLCVTMLVGNTFAWFTDTASTSVNTIQAGNLDVALEMLTDDGWVSAEGKTLDFVKATNADEGEEILWEPGCTYSLPTVRVVNKGNLALKYKVFISGTVGDTDLSEVLELSVNGQELGTLKNALNSTDRDGYAYGNLEADEDSGEITISLHMQETAGNEYQGKAISGISVTVYATQDTVEYDSTTNEYDKDATYPEVSSTSDDVNELVAAANGGDVTVVVNNATEKIELSGDTTRTTTGNGSNDNPYTTTTKLDSLTITGATLPGFSMSTGLHVDYTEGYKAGLNHHYDVWNFEIGTLTFKNITITDTVDITESDNWNGRNKIDKIVFENVTFDLANATGYGFHMICHEDTIGEVTFKNCTFVNCSHIEKPILIDVRTTVKTNITVDNCTFDGAAYNAIQLSGSGSNYAGNITITNNTIGKTGDRGIRLSSVSGTVTITGNTMTDSVDTDGEAIKFVVLTGGSYTIENNTLNGNALTVTKDANTGTVVAK